MYSQAPQRFNSRPLLSSMLLLGISGALVTAAEAPPFNTDLTVADIMAAIVMPAANVLWEAVLPDTDDSGNEIFVGPDSDEGWIRVHEAAVSLASATNLLLVPGLEVKDPALQVETPPGELTPTAIKALISSEPGAWFAHIQVMHTTAMEILKAVDTRDTRTLWDLTGTLDAPCTACHMQFWYPEG